RGVTRLCSMSQFIVKFRHFPYFFVLLALLIFSTGCTTGAKMRGQALELQELNQSLYPRAYRCAPREIALSQTHVKFGLYKLKQNDFVRAEQHLRLAKNNTKHT